MWHGLNCSFSLQRSKWVTVSSWKSPLSLFLSGNVNYLWERFISQLWGVNSKGCWSVKYFSPSFIMKWILRWGNNKKHFWHLPKRDARGSLRWNDQPSLRCHQFLSCHIWNIWWVWCRIIFKNRFLCTDDYQHIAESPFPFHFCLLRKHTKCSCFWVLYGTPHCEVCLKTQAQNCQDLFRAVTRCNKNLVSRSNANAKTSTCRQGRGFSDSCRKRMHFEIVQNCWLAGCREGNGDGKMGRVFLCTKLETNRMGLYKGDISKRQYQFVLVLVVVSLWLKTIISLTLCILPTYDLIIHHFNADVHLFVQCTDLGHSLQIKWKTRFQFQHHKQNIISFWCIQIHENGSELNLKIKKMQ